MILLPVFDINGALIDLFCSDLFQSLLGWLGRYWPLVLDLLILGALMAFVKGNLK